MCYIDYSHSYTIHKRYFKLYYDTNSTITNTSVLHLVSVCM